VHLLVGKGGHATTRIRASGPTDEVASRRADFANATRSPLMNVSSPTGNGGWSLTKADMLLCIVPIALFLSIVSFV
jgi:hypothetical protein